VGGSGRDWIDEHCDESEVGAGPTINGLGLPITLHAHGSTWTGNSPLFSLAALTIEELLHEGVSGPAGPGFLRGPRRRG